MALPVQEVFGQLNASFFTDKEGDCAPALIRFSNTTTGATANATYHWDFGNGNTSALINPSASYEMEKQYTVTLTVKDGNSQSSTTKTITVYNKPKVDFSVVNNKFCLPDAAEFLPKIVPGSGEVQTLTWDYGDGQTNTSFGNEPVNYLYQHPIVATVTLTASNSFGCYNTIQKKNILRVLPAVVPIFQSDKVFVCKSFDKVTFTNESTGPGTLSYLWDFGDNTTSNEKEPIHVFNKSGAFKVTLKVISSEGCVKTSEPLTINVENFESNFSAPALMCENDYYVLNNTSSPVPTATRWTIDNNFETITYGSQNIGYYFNKTGTIPITIINNFGTCVQTFSKNLTIKPKPSQAPFIGIQVGKCGAPDILRFNDTTTGTVKWDWTLDSWGNVTRTTKSFDYPITQNGTYYIMLKRTNAEGCTQNVNQIIQVMSPVAYIQLKSSTSNNGTQSCGPFTASFKATGSDSIVQYNWTFSNGGNSTAAEPEKAFNTEGNHIISLAYTLANGCTGTTSFSVTVYGMPKPDFSHINGPNLCGSTATQINNSTIGATSAFYWNFDVDNPNSSYYNISSTHVYTAEGKYSVGLIAVNGTCRDTIIKKDFFNVLPPFARIAEVQNTCAGTRGMVTFKHASVKGITGTWDFGDGTTAPFNQNQETISHNYTATGKYTTRLTITNGTCSSNIGVGVNVLLKQKPVLSTSQNDVCANQNFGFTLNNIEVNPYDFGSNDLYYFNRWEYTNGQEFNGVYNKPWNVRWISTISGNAISYDNKPASVRAIFTSRHFNCQDTSNFLALTFKGANAGFEVVTDKRCFSLPVVFRDTSKAVGTSNIIQRRWEFGDGRSLTTTDGGLVEHKYENPGRYRVTLSITDAGGCTVRTTSETDIIVSGPKAGFVMSGYQVPLNETIFFNNTTQTGFDQTTLYEWDFGDGEKSDDRYPYHTYPVAGTYTIRLIASNPANGCKDTAFQTLLVRPFNTAFQMNPDFIHGSNCLPVLVNFNNTSYGAARVEWDFGDGTGSEAYNATKMYSEPGKYYVKLKVFGYNGLEGTFLDSIIVGRPSATFVADPLFGCTSQGIQFNANPAKMGNYLWDFGDGTVKSSVVDSFTFHRYTTPGVYSPRLLASDSNGCIVAANIPDKIVIDSLALNLQGIPASICDSANIELLPIVTSVGSIVDPDSYKYQWRITYGGQTQQFNQKNLKFNFNKPGKYLLSFNAQSPYGCNKTITDSIQVVQGVKALISAPANACINTAVTIRGNTSQAANGIGWSWQLGNNQTSTLQNPPPQVYSQAGTYNLQLIASIGTCADTTFATLGIQSNPVLNITPSRNAVACLGTPLQLGITGAATYTWSPAVGLNNANIANPIANPLNDILYRVEAFSTIGCKNVDSIKIRVAKPITVQVSPVNQVICQGKMVQLSATGAINYQWIGTTTGLSSTSIANPQAIPMVTTNYQVVGIDADGCFRDTTALSITVNPLPVIDAGPDLQIGSNTEISLTPTGSSNITGYNWSPATFLSCTNCPNPTAKPNIPVTYVVTASSAVGCQASDTVSISLLCGESFHIPTGFSPNADNLNDRFYVLGGGATIKHFRIYNRWGKVVFERTNTQVNDRNNGWDGRFEGVLQPAGAYAYTVVLECFDGKVFEYKGTVMLIR
jgi:gliding motility-associated-like protein